MTLTFDSIPGGVLIKCDSWWLEASKHGLRLLPTPQFTYDLALAIRSGKVNAKSAAEVYQAWRDERMPAVLRGLQLFFGEENHDHRMQSLR